MVLTRSAAKAAARAARAASAQSPHDTPDAVSGGTLNSGVGDLSPKGSATPVRSLRFEETEAPSSTAESESRPERLVETHADTDEATNDVDDVDAADDLDDMLGVDVMDDTEAADEIYELGDADDVNDAGGAPLPDTDSVRGTDSVAIAIATATAIATDAINSAEQASETVLATFSINPGSLETAAVTHSLAPIHEHSNPLHSTFRHRCAVGMKTNANFPTDRSQDPETKANETVKPSQHPILSSSLSKRLAIGHIAALLAVATAAHAAYRPSSDSLIISSALLLLCIIPMRFVLSVSFSAHKHSQNPRTPSPVFISLALNGAPVFASNALHFLAIRANPVARNTYLATTVLQVCAAWLVMIVTAGSFSSIACVAYSRDAAPIIFAVIETIADIYLATIVTHFNTSPSQYPPILITRAAMDAFRLLRAAVAIVNTDTRPSQLGEHSNVTTKDTEA